jgi:hypothetical protein
MINIYTNLNQRGVEQIRGVYDKVKDGNGTILINGESKKVRFSNKNKLDNFVFIVGLDEDFYFKIDNSNNLSGRYNNKNFNSLQGFFAEGSRDNADLNIEECPGPIIP